MSYYGMAGFGCVICFSTLFIIKKIVFNQNNIKFIDYILSCQNELIHP